MCGWNSKTWTNLSIDKTTAEELSTSTTTSSTMDNAMPFVLTKMQSSNRKWKNNIKLRKLKFTLLRTHKRRILPILQHDHQRGHEKVYTCIDHQLQKTQTAAAVEPLSTKHRRKDISVSLNNKNKKHYFHPPVIWNHEWMQHSQNEGSRIFLLQTDDCI